MKCVIVGAGTYGQVYYSYLKRNGVKIAGFLDDNPSLHGTEILGEKVLGGTEMLSSKSADFDAVYAPIGNNKDRVKILSQARECGYQTPCFFHESAVISEDAKFADGIYVLAGSVIMPFAEFEDFAMVSMSVNVAHHSLLKTGAFLSTGVNFGASIVAEDFAYVGIGATIVTKVKRLGKNCLVGAGAVVVNDVPDNAVVAGVPAKVIKYRQ